MKRLIYLCIAAVMLVACDKEDLPDDICVDWTPVYFFIFAVDSAGNDIIKEDMPDMTVTFRGETYHVSNLYETTRAILPNFYGLCFIRANDTDWRTNPFNAYNPPQNNFLAFGELDGSKDMDEDIILTWPDGSKNTIHYHCSDHKVTRKEVSCKRTWKLDGKSHEGYIFEFVKDGLHHVDISN